MTAGTDAPPIVRFIAEAEGEVDEAVSYYDRQRQGLGADFAAEVQDCITRIQRHPLAWQRLSKRIRRVRLTRFPYGLVYAPLDSEIIIVAVMHLHRAPDYWKDRLSQI